MNTQLNISDFTIYPHSAKAFNISKAYREKAFNSVYHIVKALSKTACKDNSTILEKIKQIEFFSSSTSFYVLNTRLVKALKEDRSINNIITILNRFNAASIEEFINFEPNIINLNFYDWAIEFASNTTNDANEINGNDFSNMRPVNQEYFSINKEIVKQVLALLKTSTAHHFYDELIHYVSDIILFDGEGITGGSSTRTMGAIYIRVPNLENIEQSENSKELSLIGLSPLVYYLEQIIHETAHLHLDQLMEFDSIILNNPSEKFKSPIRKDLRPMRGVFHATFVLARLVDLFRTLNIYPEKNESIKIKRLNTIYPALGNGIQTINEYAKLTEIGKVLVKELVQIYKKGI